MFVETISIRTNKNFELIDITKEVNDVLKSSGAKEGLLNIFTKHTTTALFINENEEGLVKDYEDILFRLVPKRGNYRHDRIDDNAHSHLKSIILNTSITLPFKENRLLLGTWQRIFFVELDGPRTRNVLVSIIEG